MVFGNDRKQLRTMYFKAWDKAQKQQLLSPLETQIVDVIGMHPEYQKQLDSDLEAKIDKDYQQQLGEHNPFLHMGLHLGLREQLSTDRPSGIKILFKELNLMVSNSHQAEHLFMEVLSYFIWDAQKTGIAPDDQKYLLKLNLVLNKQK